MKAKKIIDVLGNDYELISHNENDDIKKNDDIEINHKICNNPSFFVKWSNVNRGYGRCKCSHKKPSGLKSNITLEDFIKELDKENYKYIEGNYKNNNSKIKCKCPNGHIIEVTWNSFITRKNRCIYCKRIENGKKRSEDTIEKIKEILNNNNCIMLEEYERLSKSIKVKCNNCGIEYNCNFGFIIKNKYEDKLCPICNNRTVLLKDINIFNTQLSNSFEGDEYELLSNKYENTHTLYKFKHLKCGTEFEMSATNFLSGNRCPRCSHTRSRLQEDLLKEIKKRYSGEIIYNDKNFLSDKKEIDIRIPEFNLAIEFNGLYWHSEEGSHEKCNSVYHLKKTEECESKNYQLFQIYSNEYENNKDIILDKIFNKMHLTENNIYARKCYIKENIDNSEKNDFLNKNHIQGKDSSSKNIGLYYNDELVALMTFATSRSQRGNTDKLELLRYCTKLNTNVCGGFSKLLKNFIKNNDLSNYKSIISYADRRYSIGTLYEKNNFKKISVSKPDYYYFKGNILYHKSLFKKSCIKTKFPEVYDDSKTELQMMRELKYKRIWNCGLILYEYKL